MLLYSSDTSIPIYFLSKHFAANVVVPLPLKGSRTIPSGAIVGSMLGCQIDGG